MFQDVKRPKKSLREILPTKKAQPQAGTGYQGRENVKLVAQPRSRALTFFLAGVGGVVIAVVFFLISGIFAEATVTITTKKAEVSLQEVIEAVKAPASDGNLLTFDVMTMPSIAEKMTLPAREKQQVSQKSTGTIVISNNYSKSTERLVANTRFEDLSGRIYRIKEAISVPGMGTAEATVIADQPGENYNQPAGAELTIPGFRGDPRYSKFIVKAKTAMAGGFVGERAVVNSETIESAKKSLLDRASIRLRDAARYQLPDDFVLFDKAIFIEVLEQKETPTESGVEISIVATLNGLIFNRRALASSIAAGRLPLLEEMEVEISNLDKLDFSIPNRDQINPSNINRLTFNLGGTALIKAVVDEPTLRQNLAGKTQQDATRTFQNLAAIEGAIVKFRLPWQRHFPSSVDRILIKS